MYAFIIPLLSLNNTEKLHLGHKNGFSMLFVVVFLALQPIVVVFFTAR